MKYWFSTILFFCFANIIVTSIVSAEVAPDPVELYRGSVTVDFIHGRGIAVGVDLPDTDRLVGDGVFDRMIVLDAYGLIPPEFPLALPDAYVAVSAGRAMVVELGGPRVVDFIVDKPTRRGGLDDGHRPSEIRLARAWSGPDERLSFTGFGLANVASSTRVIDDGSWIDRPLTRDACSAGSTSCSIGCDCAQGAGAGCATSCSVTCTSQYDACCQCRAVAGSSCFCTVLGGGGGTGGGGGGGGGGVCSTTASGCPAECFNCTQAF